MNLATYLLGLTKYALPPGHTATAFLPDGASMTGSARGPFGPGPAGFGDVAFVDVAGPDGAHVTTLPIVLATDDQVDKARRLRAAELPADVGGRRRIA